MRAGRVDPRHPVSLLTATRGPSGLRSAGRGLRSGPVRHSGDWGRQQDDGGTAAAAPSAALWERDEELAAIAEAVDVLCADRHSPGTLLVLRGEAGLGKTALLAETRRIAEQRGCTVWSARGGETLRTVPFNVVRQLLQPALVSMLPEEAREYLGDWYGIAGPALGIADPGDGQADPQGVCEGLVAAVRRLARRDWPLVLLIDDAHWADQETLYWLAAFAERLADLSVLVVVARRPGGITGVSARHLDAVAEAAGRPVTSLSALTPEAAAGLTRATLGETADAAFCREVWAVTGGNPYETVELLAKVQDSELEPVEAHAGELRELNRSARGGGLVARLEELGIDATRFAWAAAILGDGITVGLVAQLATLGHEEAVRCAERLRGARILTVRDPASAGPDELEFVHPLIATAVYNSIPDALRRAMHGIAARIVTDSGRGAAAAARHLLEVHPDDDEELGGSCARPPANTSPSAPRTPPAAAWNAPWRNRPAPRCTHTSCMNWAAPPSSPHPPAPSAICAPHSACPDWTASDAWTP